MTRPYDTKAHPRHTWGWTKLRNKRIKAAAANDEPCCRCGKPIDYTLSGRHQMGPTADHLHPLGRGGELLPDLDLLAPAHNRCNSRHGSRLGAQMVNAKKRNGKGDKPISFGNERKPAFTVSKSPQLSVTAPWIPVIPTKPRMESPVPAEATGSYGAGFSEWCSVAWPESPLPWQAYVAARALEHDADGLLVHRRVGISVPRQVGKSVFLRMLAAWRINSEAMFGEPQTVLHVAHALNTTEEVFYPAVQWAKDRGYRVREANGQMKIQVGGNRWVPRSTQTGYGFTLSLALVDEAWAVAERRVNSGYAPTLSARRSGQVWMFSSANEEATPLFPKFREAALSRPGWLLLEWSAPPGARLDDRAVWDACSPVPVDRTRAALMADELASDSRTFAFERLNRWPDHAGVPWGQRVAALLGAPSEPVWGGPLIGGLESEPDGSKWGAAVSDGAHLECVEAATRSDAVAWLVARSPVRVVAHGAAIKQLGDGIDLVCEAMTVQGMAAASQVLRDSAASLSWSGPLGDRLRGADVAVTAAGERVDAARSSGPVSVVKAASWALWAASTQPVVAPAIW